ncbi:uncharacterized protein LOC135840818 isoform X10 [Planococcus citri]|uniref:uncharacterized protein LOC135840818 isoform X10 n=1 Tax=Planococcus citri TaxID=170843 RepID=UPI0031F9D84B
MAEVTTNVYDLLFPSPADLKEIAAISIATQLWRQEINTHRIKNTLSQLNLEQNILLSTSMPSIPSSILSDIEKYVLRFGMSIQEWLSSHEHMGLFKKEIFNSFIDLAADFDGTVHYVRTAKRILQCDELDQILRFNIACKYCFEDDILRILPLVSDYAKTVSTSSDPYDLSFYWVCRLKNQLYKLPRPNDSARSIEEQILRTDVLFKFPYAWSCVEHFWSRLDADARRRVVNNYDENQQHVNLVRMVCRYLLQSLNDVLIREFISIFSCRVLTKSLRTPRFRNDSRRLYIMATWTYLKNKMNTLTFVAIVTKIIQMCGNDTSMYGELWATAPDNLKQHALQAIFSGQNSFVNERILKDPDSFAFLLTLLSCASSEQRRIFWETHWRDLIRIKCVESLDELMSLCFSNDENEIMIFKLNSLSQLQNIRNICLELLSERNFEKLDEFLNFCCPDEATLSTLKQNLINNFKFTYKDVQRPHDQLSSQLNDFINDAYNNNMNQAARFRTRLLSSPSHSIITTLLFGYLSAGRFHHAIHFIDTLAPSEQVAINVKRLHILPRFQAMLRDGRDYTGTGLFHFEEHQFLNFLRDCFGNDEEIAAFKQTLNADEIVQNAIRGSVNRPHNLKYNYFLVEFLEWYFSTPEALDEFRSRYAGDEVFVLLTTKNE